MVFPSPVTRPIRPSMVPLRSVADATCCAWISLWKIARPRPCQSGGTGAADAQFPPSYLSATQQRMKSGDSGRGDPVSSTLCPQGGPDQTMEPLALYSGSWHASGMHVREHIRHAVVQVPGRLLAWLRRSGLQVP